MEQQNTTYAFQKIHKLKSVLYNLKITVSKTLVTLDVAITPPTQNTRLSLTIITRCLQGVSDRCTYNTTTYKTYLRLSLSIIIICNKWAKRQTDRQTQNVVQIYLLKKYLFCPIVTDTALDNFPVLFKFLMKLFSYWRALILFFKAWKLSPRNLQILLYSFFGKP